jgi:hypothetical protein
VHDSRGRRMGRAGMELAERIEAETPIRIASRAPRAPGLDGDPASGVVAASV